MVPITVMVADGSAISRQWLIRLLEADPKIRVLGAVDNGEAALNFVQKHSPNVVVMDIQMPGMAGFETTRRIMETAPVPIVICSAVKKDVELALTFRGLEAGAVACLPRPQEGETPEALAAAANFRETVKLMAEVKVVRRWPRARLAARRPRVVPGVRVNGSAPPYIIGIGASTGGPPVLQTLLAGLPPNFPAPILIVQHIAAGFLPGLAGWLSESTGFPVEIAAHGIAPLAGRAYLAPDDYHMGLDASGCIALVRGDGRNGPRPAVSFLFNSLAEVCGKNAVGVMLTGMGKDGAAELKQMRDKGAVTVVQDRESSVVYGMPGEAIALGAAAHVVPAEQIASLLLSLANQTHFQRNPSHE